MKQYKQEASKLSFEGNTNDVPVLVRMHFGQNDDLH